MKLASSRPAPSRPAPSRPAVGVLLALGLTAACEPPGGALPSRVPGDGAGVVLNVPYPMADAERIEGVGRAALAQASFVLIALGATPDDRDHALPERIAWDGEGPLLVAHHVEPVGPTAAAWQPLSRRVLQRGPTERNRALPIDASEIEDLGLRPPAATVWLVGPRGSCRAEVGEPVVAVYGGTEDAVMVGYVLRGCAGRGWAQIGIVADTYPVDFRWVPATASPEVVAPHGRGWEDPLAALVEAPAWSHAADPGFDLVRLREIPGAAPRVLQIHHALLADLPGEDEGAWCDVDVSWVRTDGWYNERWIDPVPFTSDAVGPFMLGAFVNGTQVDAVIYDDRLDGLVVVPPGPLADMDDPTAWRQVFVPTGRYDVATLAAWGVQPARGALPVGPTCPDDEAAP